MTGYQDLATYVTQFASASVLCVGDVMLDHFIYGEVNRLSPEGPIPILQVEREHSMLGGAGNAVRNICALGATVRFLTVVGDDAPANEIHTLLSHLPACQAHVERDRSRRTTVKTRYVAQGQQLLRTDSEARHPISAGVLERLLDEFARALRSCNTVLLSDYAKGVLNGDNAQQFIRLAKEAGKPVLVDPKGRDFRRYRGATLIKPNLQELGAVLGTAGCDDAAVESGARKIINDCAVDAVLVTRGGSGMTLVRAGMEATSVVSWAREVYDVSGAGDTVAGALATAIAAGVSIEHAIKLANLAAGLVVAKVGTATVNPSELIHEIQQQAVMESDRKVMDLADAIERVALWRRKGLRVGFTNGCFDLLHPGHITLLNQAKTHCDRLVVGLNSDSSVARVKGAGRPIQDEIARSIVLASLSCVDMVIIFSEDTPEALIRAVQPMVLVKGADYRPEEVVGADLVTGWGGDLVLVDLVPNSSTTNIVQQVRQGFSRTRDLSRTVGAHH